MDALGALPCFPCIVKRRLAGVAIRIACCHGIGSQHSQIVAESLGAWFQRQHKFKQHEKIMGMRRRDASCGKECLEQLLGSLLAMVAHRVTRCLARSKVVIRVKQVIGGFCTPKQ